MGCCMPLKNHHDLRMPGKLAVELIELLAGARVDHASQRQVLALARRPHFHGRAVEIGDVAQHDIEHQLREPIFGAAHDLDWERAGKFEQRFGHGLFHRSNMGTDLSREKGLPFCYGRYMYSRIGGCGSRPPGKGLPASSWKIDSQPRSNA